MLAHCMLWPCVCLRWSVASECSIKMARHIIVQLMRHVDPGNLVFWCQLLNSSGVNSVCAKSTASIAMGQGDMPPQYLDRGYYHECPRLFKKSSRLCWFRGIFISPKHCFTLVLTKRLQLLGEFVPQTPYYQDLDPAGGLPSPESLLCPQLWRQIYAYVPNTCGIGKISNFWPITCHIIKNYQLCKQTM